MIKSLGIHTIDITNSTGNFEHIKNIFEAFRFSKEEQSHINEFLFENGKPKPVSKAARASLGIRGINYLLVYQVVIRANPIYYVKLRMDPAYFLSSSPQIDLFHNNVFNVVRLADSFRETMKKYFPDDDMDWFCTFGRWEPRRIDCTMNIEMPSQEDLNRFLDVTKTSGFLSRIKSLYLPSDYDDFDYDEHESTAAGNKSWKGTLYDKKKEVAEKYSWLPQDEYERMLSEATNIIRFEAQCNKGTLRGIAEKYKFKTPSIVNFLLNSKMVQETLFNKYLQVVGFGDFYTIQKVRHIIKKDTSLHLSDCLKRNLYRFMRVAGTCNTFADVKEKFIKGVKLAVKGKRVLMGGSSPTYYKLRSYLMGLDINPLPIKKSVYGVNYIKNPVSPYDFPKVVGSTDNAIKVSMEYLLNETNLT